MAWNALVDSNDPFSEHGFLAALEDSGSVGAASGWQPLHVTLWRGDELRAVLPLYLKSHSYGEFTFDFGWANGALSAGIAYYPKLVSMVPFTPATGQRFLVHPDEDRGDAVGVLLTGARELAAAVKASSIHLLYLSEEDRELVAQHGERFLSRMGMQFHWHNEGYASFEDHLARFRSAVRKETKKERQRSVVGLDVRVVTGAAITLEQWEALEGFYRSTCAQHGSEEYLTPEFFELLRTRAPERAVAVLAYEGETIVAGTLNFEKGKHLYGRYWGAVREVPLLHFELCYHQLIERAIELRMERVEAGAQGSHKLRRGLMPSPTYSAHWFAHTGLGRAVANFVAQEAEAVAEQIAEMAPHGPYKSENAE